MLDGRERTFCSSCLILLLWFCSSAAAHRAGGQHAVHNGLDGGSALTEHTVQQPFHLGEPNPRVRLQAVRLEDVHGPARRYGRAAARLVGRGCAPQQPFSVMAVRSAARGGKERTFTLLGKQRLCHPPRMPSCVHGAIQGKRVDI